MTCRLRVPAGRAMTDDQVDGRQRQLW